jgi:hypothetical protein
VSLVGVRLLPVEYMEVAVGGGVIGTGPSKSSEMLASCFRDDFCPSAELNKSEKSAVVIEKRIGGSAGAMNVECEVCSTGEDSDISSELSG